MKKIRNITTIFLAFIMVLGYSGTSKAVLFYEDKISSALAGNLETGQLYYTVDPDKSVGIASMSKLMTYYITKQNIKEGKFKLSDVITVSKAAAFANQAGYSNMSLTAGVKVTIEDLLKGLLVLSGNDAAVALAEKVSGTEANFVKLMNAKAKELGFKHSVFYNSNGVTIFGDPDTKADDKYNKMSTRELFALIRNIFKEFPETSEYAAIDQLTIPHLGLDGKSTIPLKNEVKGVIGLKTGTTDEAGYCFSGVYDISKQDDSQKYKVVTIVTGANGYDMRNKTSLELLNYVTENYEYRPILRFSDVSPVTDYKASAYKEDFIPLYLEDAHKDTYLHTKPSDVKITLNEGVKAPYEDGQVLGQVTVMGNDKKEIKINLINKGYKAKVNFISRIGLLFKRILKGVVGLV